jgi:hypothetical protein
MPSFHDTLTFCHFERMLSLGMLLRGSITASLALRLRTAIGPNIESNGRAELIVHPVPIVARIVQVEIGQQEFLGSNPVRPPLQHGEALAALGCLLKTFMDKMVTPGSNWSATVLRRALPRLE